MVFRRVSCWGVLLIQWCDLPASSPAGMVATGGLYHAVHILVGTYEAVDDR